MTVFSSVLIWFGAGCKLNYLDLSSFNTNKVTNMSYMFFNCNNLSILDLSSFNNNNVTDINSIFKDSENVKNLIY